MSRMARVVLAGYPHHVIQRGNRRQNVFFCDEDKKEYLCILKEQSEKYGVDFWAYCLMDNHVHLIAVPRENGSLAQAIGETHRRYTRMINFRKGWRGYLWQGRFSSFIMDEKYLYYGLRYVERNPVRAGLVKRAEDYQWLSARAHVKGEKDSLLVDFYLYERIQNWREYLNESTNDAMREKFHKHMSTGRPLGNENFIEILQKKIGRILKKQKPGPKINN